MYVALVQLIPVCHNARFVPMSDVCTVCTADPFLTSLSSLPYPRAWCPGVPLRYLLQSGFPFSPPSHACPCPMSHPPPPPPPPPSPSFHPSPVPSNKPKKNPTHTTMMTKPLGSNDALVRDASQKTERVKMRLCEKIEKIPPM